MVVHLVRQIADLTQVAQASKEAMTEDMKKAECEWEKFKKEDKENIITIFSNAQKHYHAFSRFAYIYKLKKYPCIVTDDLSLNPLNPNHKNTFTLVENKSKYLFSLNDLISIIETAIGNSPNFFSEPLSPVNPYNKQIFTNSTLYNIYFKMKEFGNDF